MNSRVVVMDESIIVSAISRIRHRFIVAFISFTVIILSVKSRNFDACSHSHCVTFVSGHRNPDVLPRTRAHLVIIHTVAVNTGGWLRYLYL